MAELVDRDDGADTPHENEGRARAPVPRNKKKGKGKKKAAPTLTSEAQRREELQQLVARMRRSEGPGRSRRQTQAAQILGHATRPEIGRGHRGRPDQ